jgi:hypothetical protein
MEMIDEMNRPFSNADTQRIALGRVDVVES